MWNVALESIFYLFLQKQKIDLCGLVCPSRTSERGEREIV